MTLQDHFGPRCCIPSSFFPRGYDYYRPVPASLLQNNHSHNNGDSRTDDGDSRNNSNNNRNDDSNDGSNESDEGIDMRSLTNANGMIAVPLQEPSTALDNMSSNRDIESGNLNECVICYNGIEIDNHNGRSNQPPTYMITPCNHLFHPNCLQQWLTVKMECPTCRAVLPLSESDDPS